jgi:hypothetical protein
VQYILQYSPSMGTESGLLHIPRAGHLTGIREYRNTGKGECRCWSWRPSPPWRCPDGRCMMIMVMMSSETKPSRGVGEPGAVSPSDLSSGRGLHCIYHILLVRSVRSTAYLESSSRMKITTSDQNREKPSQWRNTFHERTQSEGR